MIVRDDGTTDDSGFKLGAKSLKMLEGVHPDMCKVAPLALKYSIYDWAITEGKRTYERQKELYESPEKVTHTMKSMHLPQADGFSWAIDVMAVGDLDKDGDVDAQDKKRTWDPVIYTAISKAFKRAAAELGIGLKWGGDFKRRNGKPFFDGPHFERTKKAA